MKLLIINNPYSGKNDPKKIEYLKNKLSNYYEITKFDSYQLGSITNYIVNEMSEDYDVIVICGGDGTVNEAIKALVKRNINPKIAIVPFGTLNDFAHYLKMSKNIEKTVEYIKKSKTIKHNIYSANDSFFIYGFAIGMLSNISYARLRHKRLFGRLSYYFVALKEIFKSKKTNIILTVNDKQIKLKCNLVLAYSTNRIAGYNVKKNEKLTIVVLKGLKLFFPFKLFFYFITGCAKYKFFADEFKIESNSIEFNTDGERNSYNNAIKISKGKEFEFITK